MEQYHYQLIMTKPLGYYCAYTPGDEGLLAEMEEAWGAQLESLTNVERTWMIMKIGENLCFDFEETDDDESVSEDVEKVVKRIWNNELSRSDQLGLLAALVNQVKTLR